MHDAVQGSTEVYQVAESKEIQAVQYREEGQREKAERTVAIELEDRAQEAL